ncbi:hypothetical protein [Pilimelia columellifera]|uniref:Uncharacterized protein n=1 Tax=Pilimelia columellifera subsp. columellifera TaxID=706583 RepID=A0ABN3N4N3_9ACTN
MSKDRNRSGRRSRRGWLAAALAAAALVAAPLPASANAETQIDMKLLVITDGRSNVGAVTATLEQEGVPYTIVDTRDANRPKITEAFLSDTVGGRPRAKFQAVVLADENALPQAELTALTEFEKEFEIRQLIAYTWANPAVGLGPARWSGTVDGMTATVTPAAIADGFGYLNGRVPFDNLNPTVDESYAAVADPLVNLPAGESFTPLVTMPVPGAPANAAPGVVAGVYAHDGREDLVLTVTLGAQQTHARVLAHGIVEWLTKGVYVGYWRNFLSVHIDDVLMPNARWQRPDSVGPAPEQIRMVPADVEHLVRWQRDNNVSLDVAFNAKGSTDAGGAADPLTKSVLANKDELRWLNHTWGHEYLGCQRDAAMSCVNDANGKRQYISQNTISTQISQNVEWAAKNGVSMAPTELVTGEHSGLRSVPKEPIDNPNLAAALKANKIGIIASDNSLEKASRKIGTALTLPRHPMNIFYNVGTRMDEVDQYNWIYTSKADGGSGNCEASSSCIPPLVGADAFDKHIVPVEARVMLGHMITNDPRPHYVHQSNITEDRILYPVLDTVLAEYRAIYANHVTLLNPTMTEASELLEDFNAWRAAVRSGAVRAYQIGDRVHVVNDSRRAVRAPFTAPRQTRVSGAERGLRVPTGYGPGVSGWATVDSRSPLTLRLPRD